MSDVSLKDFVSNVLTEICCGVQDANEKYVNINTKKTTKTQGAPSVSQPFTLSLTERGNKGKSSGVKFDVNVVVSNSSKTDGGLLVASGLVNAGAKHNKDSLVENTHRVTFEVGMRMDIGHNYS